MNLKKLIALFGVFLLVAPEMVAQDSDADESAEEIETVIVTATRRETDLMDTPLAVSAITNEELVKYGLSNIKDLSYAIPGLSIQNQTDTNAPIITLRGVRSNNVTEVGDPAVGIHVDGVYAARPQAAAALMFDLERAELLRGLLIAQLFLGQTLMQQQLVVLQHRHHQREYLQLDLQPLLHYWI